MRRISIVLSALFAILAFLPSGTAHADPYSPEVATSCTVETPGAIDGERVVFDVAITSNSAAQPSGTVSVSVSKGSGNNQIWSRSVPYAGSPVRITGPRLKTGRYTAKAAFNPSTPGYASCTGSLAFRVSPGAVSPAAEGPGNGDDAGAGAGAGNGAGAGGLLPNTGGPHLALLLLGLGLVAAGGGVVERSRRFA